MKYQKLEWHEYLVLVFLFLLIFKLMIVRLIDVNVHKVCPIVPTSETISAKEAEVFLKQWQEYTKRGYMAKVPEDFAFDGIKPEERLPWIVQRWFEKKCINPRRFYYTEQRLRAILKAQELAKHTERVINVLQAQIKSGIEDSEKKWYKDLIEEQKQMSTIEGISDAELEIVAGRESKIREILR